MLYNLICHIMVKYYSHLKVYSTKIILDIRLLIMLSKTVFYCYLVFINSIGLVLRRRYM